MPRLRTPRRGHKYWMPRHMYRMTVEFCRSYGELKQQLNELTFLASPNMDGMPHSNDVSDSTARNAMAVMRVREKLSLIEDSVRDCSGGLLYPFMLKAVTIEGWGWQTAQAEEIPIGRSAFFELKYKILYEVSRKL